MKRPDMTDPAVARALARADAIMRPHRGEAMPRTCHDCLPGQALERRAEHWFVVRNGARTVDYATSRKAAVHKLRAAVDNADWHMRDAHPGSSVVSTIKGAEGFVYAHNDTGHVIARVHFNLINATRG